MSKLADATRAGGYLYLTDDDAAPLVAAGLAEVNPNLKDSDGNEAIRATEAGLEAMPASPEATTSSTVSVKIRTGIVVPARTRAGRGREEKYPFSTLNVGDGFHIPVTADMPQPWKTLQSTISSANARFAVEKKDSHGNVIMESKQISKAQRDSNNNVIKGPDGKMFRVTVTESLPVLEYQRRFTVFRAPDGDPDGPGAIVTRIS
jgi:hypothetical protein